jgi:Domain of unknown function (DUF4328)
MPCPRCRHRTDPAAGPFCPHCGRYLASLQWVAEPPPTAASAPPEPLPSRYTGPPRYRQRPQGGFSALPWRPPGDAPVLPPPPEQAARAVAGVAVPLLWALAAVALLAGAAEVWRYALLLASRDRALSADAVAASDALVLAAGVAAVLLQVTAGGFLVMWTLQASTAAAARSGSHPSRSPRDVVLGWLVPGLNLAVPGSVFAEIEHGALDRPPRQRPRPSGAVRVWWLLWAAGVVASAVTFAWSRRTGVQAQADGVVLHATLDLVAAVTAGYTAVLVGRLTALLGPVRQPRREVVLAVSERAVRPSPAARANPA